MQKSLRPGMRGLTLISEMFSAVNDLKNPVLKKKKKKKKLPRFSVKIGEKRKWFGTAAWTLIRDHLPRVCVHLKA